MNAQPFQAPPDVTADFDLLADLSEPPPPLPAEDAERIAHLLAELPAIARRSTTPKRCRCEHPIVGADEDGCRCWLCGRAPQTEGAM